MYEQLTEAEQASVTRAVAGMSSYEHTRKRADRETLCQYVALGVWLSKGINGANPEEFEDADVRRVMEAMSGFEPGKTENLREVREWMRRHLGVMPQQGERLSDAVLRTVSETHRCVALSRIGGMLQMAGSSRRRVDVERVIEQLRALEGDMK